MDLFLNFLTKMKKKILYQNEIMEKDLFIDLLEAVFLKKAILVTIDLI